MIGSIHTYGWSVSRPRVPFRQSALRIGFYALATITVVIMVFPYYWQFITALKEPGELYLIPPSWFPKGLYLGSFVAIFTQYGFITYMLNSVVVAGTTTFVAIGVGSLAAYALARLPIKGRMWILGGILSASLLPGTAIVGPIFLLISSVGLVNTYPGLVWPYTSFSLPFSVWVLSNFYSQIPVELEEAAAVDGCSPLQAFLKVIFPLSAPGLATTAILVFIGAWNEFLFALVLTRTAAVRTVPLGIASFAGIHDELPWGAVSAASVFVTLPLIILAIIFQKHIVQGLTAGAVKG
jgi:multiple sugar transport system permease protein